MKILIDFTQIPVQKSGVGVYALNLIKKIYESDKANIYYILVQNDDNSFDFMTDHRFYLIKVRSKFFRILLLRFFLEQFFILFLVIKYRINVVHSLHYSFPLLLPARRVVTIHDLTFIKFPKEHIAGKVFYFSFFIKLSTFFADRIITVSESTLNDFRERFKFDTKKMRAIHHGKNPSLNPYLDKTKINKVRLKYGINKEYLLFLGTIEPRKNIKSLLLAYEKFLKENNSFQLVIAGKKGWFYKEIFQLAERINLNNSIIFTGYIVEEDKPFLISGAKIFIYPSIYEGFGIPVLEAISCGIPTITSNISSLPEVAGDAALLIDPNNVEELYLNIKKVINDDHFYNELKRRSIEQAKKFSWEKAACETIEVYNSLQ